jgi:hypothetical protein
MAVDRRQVESGRRQVRQRGETCIRPDDQGRLLDPFGRRVARAVGNGLRERLVPGHVLQRDDPHIRVRHRLGHRGVHVIAGGDGHGDRDRWAGDDLPPGRVGGLAGRGNVLLGAGLDQGVVADVAVRVDAATADADPVGRELVLAVRVPAGGRHRPVAGDGVEEGAALLERPLVVAEPVRALVRVRTDLQELPMSGWCSSGSSRSGEPQRSAESCDRRDRDAHLSS